MTRLTVPDTIELADVSIYLSANYQGNGNLFGERLATTAPQTIALVADALRWHYESFPAISITDAVGSITVDNVGNDGDTITVLVHDVILGTIILGTYIKNSSDTTTSILATHIAAALTNLNGYTVTVLNNIITITVRPGLGSSMNGGNRLQAIINVPTITPVGSLIFPNTIVGNTSASQYFLVSGTTLYNAPGSITIYSPSVNFEVSNDNVNWGSSTTISFVSDIIYNAQVFVRFTPQSVGALSTNLQITGGGVTVPVLMPASGNGVNTPALAATPINPFDGLPVGYNSPSQTSNITGTDLINFPGVVTVNAPSTDFQVSNNNTTWGSSTTIPYTSATLASTPIYVRFSPQSIGAKTGNVGVSGSTTSTTIAVTGTGLSVMNIAATGLTSIQFEGISCTSDFAVLWNQADVTTIEYFAAGSHTPTHTYPSNYTGNIKLATLSLADFTVLRTKGSPNQPQGTTSLPITIAGSELTKLTNLITLVTRDGVTYSGNTTSLLPRTLVTIAINYSNLSGSVGSLPPALQAFYITATTIAGSLSSMFTQCPSLTVIEVSSPGINITGNISSLPSTMSDFIIDGGNTISGNLSSLTGLTNLAAFSVASGNPTITGDLSDVPWTNMVIFGIGGDPIHTNPTTNITGDIDLITFNASMTQFYLAGGINTITGDISQFPSTLTSLQVDGDGAVGEGNTLSGNINTLSTNLTKLTLAGKNTVTGSLSSYQPTSLVTMQISGVLNGITGNVNDLPPNVAYVDIESVTVTGTYTASRTWASTMYRFIWLGVPISDVNQVNNMFIDLNGSAWSNYGAIPKLIQYAGATPTGAGLAAKDSLVNTKGVTVVII